jgi:hypothetical protein
LIAPGSHSNPTAQACADLDKTIVYATALTTMVKRPDAARDRVKYPPLPGSVPVIKKNGMDPA